MTLYETLGVSPGASRDEIREVYLALARQHHPDAGGSVEQMRDVNRAWAVLGNEERRRRYDRELAHVDTEPPSVDPDIDLINVEEIDDPLDDLVDDRPLSAGGPGGVVVLVPPGLFAASVVTFSGAVVMSSPGLFGFAFLLFALSLLAFAFVTLFALHRSARGGRRSR